MKKLVERLRRKAFRETYVSEHVSMGIAYQIQALREQRGWSQGELARRMNTSQSAISRMENPDYGRLSVQSLLELAATFDVGLLVRFVTFSEVISRSRDLSPKAFEVPSFADDPMHWPEATRSRRPVTMPLFANAFVTIETSTTGISSQLTAVSRRGVAEISSQDQRLH